MTKVVHGSRPDPRAGSAVFQNFTDRLGQVIGFSNIAGQVGSSREVFKSRGPDRVGPGQVRKFFKISQAESG